MATEERANLHALLNAESSSSALRTSVRSNSGLRLLFLPSPPELSLLLKKTCNRQVEQASGFGPKRNLRRRLAMQCEIDRKARKSSGRSFCSRALFTQLTLVTVASIDLGSNESGKSRKLSMSASGNKRSPRYCLHNEMNQKASQARNR